MAAAKGLLLNEPTYDILMPATNVAIPFATMAFWLSRTSGGLQLPATVYQDGAMQVPYASNVVIALANGTFPPIYVNPSLPMRVQVFTPAGQLLQDVDPYVLNSRFIASATVAVNESQLINTTLTPDQYLQIKIPYAGTYRFEMQAEFICSANSGTNPNANFGLFLAGGGANANLFNVLAQNGGLLQDVAVAVQIPGGVTTAFAQDAVTDPGTGTIYPSGSTGVVAYPITLSTSTHTPAHTTGMFTCTAPCTLIFAWSQNVSSAVSLTLLRGSYLKVQNIQPTVQAGVSITAPLVNLDYNGQMVINQTGSPTTFYGFSLAGFNSNPAFGSVSPVKDVQGTSLGALYVSIFNSGGLTYQGLTFALVGTVAQNYMASVTTGGITYPTAFASTFTQAGGYTTWTWGVPFAAPSWAGRGSGTVKVTLP